MRKLLHKFIDNIFDELYQIKNNIAIVQNMVDCYFRKPKYSIGQIVNFYGQKRIIGFYKIYEYDWIFYNLEGFEHAISEGVVNYHNKENEK